MKTTVVFDLTAAQVYVVMTSMVSYCVTPTKSTFTGVVLFTNETKRP